MPPPRLLYLFSKQASHSLYSQSVDNPREVEALLLLKRDPQHALVPRQLPHVDVADKAHNYTRRLLLRLLLLLLLLLLLPSLLAVSNNGTTCAAAAATTARATRDVLVVVRGLDSSQNEHAVAGTAEVEAAGGVDARDQDGALSSLVALVVVVVVRWY